MARKIRHIAGALNLTRDLPVEVVTMNDGEAEYSPNGGDILEIDRITVGMYRNKIQIHVRPARK